MRFAYFLSFFDRADAKRQVDAATLDRVAGIVRTTSSLTRGLVYHADRTVGRHYPNDDAPPQLALQLYFDEIADLEAAVARDGHLQQLALPSALPELADAEVQQQAMNVRRFRVPEPKRGKGQSEPFCTFLVHYPGAAEDLNAWLDHYVRNHPPIMAKFPGVREVEVCSCMDWLGFLPWPRVDHMQRNKVVFDSAEDLVAALNSPVRAEMTADFNALPPFSGGNAHYPLTTREILP